jgi:hypothetical protein
MLPPSLLVSSVIDFIGNIGSLSILWVGSVFLFGRLCIKRGFSLAASVNNAGVWPPTVRRRAITILLIPSA